MRKNDDRKDGRMFPLFIDIGGKNVVVVGGGTIASRRIKTLLEGGFGAKVKVISPEISDIIREELGRRGEDISWTAAAYDEACLENADAVLACTSDEDVNSRICRDCRQRGIPVNNAGDHNLCDFHFPGIIIEDGVVIGFNGGGKDHGKVKLLRQHIEEWLHSSREKGNR